MLNRIKKIIKENWLGILLLLFLVILFFRSYEFGKFFGFIDFGFSFLDIEQAIKNNLFVRGEKRSFGENQFNFLFDIFEYFCYHILMIIGFSKELVPGVLQLLMILLIPYLFFKNLTLLGDIGIGKKINSNYFWTLAFLPIFTLGFFNEQWHVLFSQRYAWIISLIIFYYLNKFIFQGKGMLGLIISALFSIFAFNLFPFFLAFHIFLFLYLVFLFFNKRISFKKILILYISYIGLTAVARLNIIFLYASLDFSQTDAVKYGSDLKTYVSSNNHIDNLLRGVFHLIWDGKLARDATTETFNYQKYYTDGFFLILSYCPLFLFLLILSCRKNGSEKTKYGLFFVALLLFALFVAKANNRPLGEWFIYLLDKFELLNIYRSPANKFMPIFYTVFTFAFYVFISGLNRKKQKIIFNILGFYYLFFSVPLFISGIYSKYSFFVLPKEYALLKKELDGYSGRVLFLPERDYGKQYVFSGYVNSINYFLLSNTTFDIGQTLLSNNNVGLSKKLLNSVNFFDSTAKTANTGDIYQRGEIINFTGDIDLKKGEMLIDSSKIDVIVLDRNLIGTFNVNYITEKEWDYYDFFLRSLEGKFYKKNIGKLEIYIRKNRLYGDNIFNFNQRFSFIKKSPVFYDLTLNLKPGLNNLEMISSFDSGWNLYFKNDLILQSPVGDHHKIYEYANGRTLDADYIKQNFPKEYYKENPDGSIDVNLTLYFKPQSYFYLGLGVSGLTFLGLITRLIIDRRKQKKSDSK